jgi:transposase
VPPKTTKRKAPAKPKAKRTPKADPKPRGRPDTYSETVAATIIDRLASGDSLRKICKSPGMPKESTVRLWATSDRNGFAAHYTRAREAQMDALAEDILEIADDDKADVNRARLRVDTRKWLMSKIAPKRFGEKRSHELSGPNGGPIEYANLTEEEIDARIAALTASAGEDDVEAEA